MTSRHHPNEFTPNGSPARADGDRDAAMNAATPTGGQDAQQQRDRFGKSKKPVRATHLPRLPATTIGE